MKKQHKLGVFLEGGGIKTFYGGGVIDQLKAFGIKPDYYAGISASAGTIFGNIFSCSEEIIDIFGKRCDNNKKNFYFFRKPHFPHNHMMENSLIKIFDKHIKNPNSKSEFKIIAGITNNNYSWVKTHLVLYLMIMKNLLRINLFDYFRKMFSVKESSITSDDNLDKKVIVNFIMGSSSIYPFIKPHYHDGKLLLEANCLDLDYQNCLSNCDKGIIIHNSTGKSFVNGKFLHVYSSTSLPSNILDYTSKEKLVSLRKVGMLEVKKQKFFVEKFISS
ncbi:MAG: patatin-like phospholipase family protein [Nanoarchaeota archaeon]